jgi:hypothetical protein
MYTRIILVIYLPTYPSLNPSFRPSICPSFCLSVCLSVYGSTALVDLGRILTFLIYVYTVGRTPWTGDQPVARPLPTHRTTQTQNKHTQTAMPLMGFEQPIPVFERARRLMP